MWDDSEAREESFHWYVHRTLKKEIIHLNLDLLPIMFLLKNRFNKKIRYNNCINSSQAL